MLAEALQEWWRMHANERGNGENRAYMDETEHRTYTGGNVGNEVEKVRVTRLKYSPVTGKSLYECAVHKS